MCGPINLPHIHKNSMFQKEGVVYNGIGYFKINFTEFKITRNKW